MSIHKKIMNEETYEGIPRNKIPWGPRINYEECVSCGKCVDFCSLGVYEFEEKEGKKKSVVKYPNNCVVSLHGL
jgi:ferredoxin